MSRKRRVVVKVRGGDGYCREWERVQLLKLEATILLAGWIPPSGWVPKKLRRPTKNPWRRCRDPR